MPVLLHESAVAFLTACLLACSVCGSIIPGGVINCVLRRNHCAHMADVISHATALQQMLQHGVLVKWLPKMLVTDHGMYTARNSSAEEIMLKFLVLCTKKIV